jgi:hypothetical protein
MKTIRKITSGLISDETFEDATFAEPLRVKATYDYDFDNGNSRIVLGSGDIYFPVFPYQSCVFLCENIYVPTNLVDVAGIYIRKGTERKELFEYYNDDLSTFPFVKVSKIGDVYYGSGSENNINWEDRGYVTLPAAEDMGISLYGNAPYIVDRLSIYKSDYVKFFGLLSGWIVNIYNDNDTLFMSVPSTGNAVDVMLPYPFSGRVDILENNIVKAQKTLVDVWGGDEYSTDINVEILSMDDEPITEEHIKHMGNIMGGELYTQFKARNSDIDPASVTISIAEFSPFYDWAYLAEDNPPNIGDPVKSLSFTVPGNSDTLFWIAIIRPTTPVQYDYKNNECLFYLTVE